MRRGPVSPNDVLEKKEGVRAWRGLQVARASEMNLRQFGARGGASRGRVLPETSFDQKSTGYTLL